MLWLKPLNSFTSILQSFLAGSTWPFYNWNIRNIPLNPSCSVPDLSQIPILGYPFLQSYRKRLTLGPPRCSPRANQSPNSGPLTSPPSLDLASPTPVFLTLETLNIAPHCPFLHTPKLSLTTAFNRRVSKPNLETPF